MRKARVGLEETARAHGTSLSSDRDVEGHRAGTRLAVSEARVARTKAKEREMLDAYVIEEIKRRDRDKSRDDRPVVELPLPSPAHRPDRDEEPNDRDGDRGVVIIDYSG
jgi:hypothetical protein